jgi:uncharacterized protein
MTSMSPTLTEIHVYPVKSCRGIAVNQAHLDDWGLQFDRNWMVVNQSGRFLSQREAPQLALVETAIGSDCLKLTAPGQPLLELPLEGAADAADRPVEIWRDQCQAADQGEPAAQWFSQVVGQPARLVKIGHTYNRPVANAPAQVSFADGYPLLLISTGSLADLNQRLPSPIPMNRFRPNLVVAGCDPYAEDTWQQISLNGVRFDLVKACERCVITTTDQATGTRANSEPLKTLATYRRVPGGVIFGQNLVHQTHGQLVVGSSIEVVK